MRDQSRFDAYVVGDGSRQSAAYTRDNVRLFLHGNVSEEELNLVELTACDPN